MGNECSSVDQNTKAQRQNDLSLGFYDNGSSYNGIKTNSSATEQKCRKSSSSDHLSEKTTQQTSELIQDFKVPVLFEWTEGGNNVVLTGTFVKWEQFFQMTKTQCGSFELMLSLDPCIHQFKYVVDNQWRCSKKYPTKDDGSYNINNVMDTSTLPKPPQEAKKQLKKAPSLQSAKQSDTKDSYSVYIPKRNEMNSEASFIPLQYLKCFDINRQINQRLIGKQNYIQSSEENLLNENNTFKKIFIPPHVNL